MIERISERGGGYGEIIDIEARPNWGDRLARMLESGIMPNTLGHLGPGFQRHSLLNYRLGDKKTISTEEPVPYLQAPYPTPSLHPFTYRPIFLLPDLGSRSPPREIMLRFAPSGTETKIPHILSVQPTGSDQMTSSHLAVKAVLIDLDSEVSHGDWGPDKVQLARLNAEHLGTTYSITSKWTSFVAVDEKRNVAHDVELSKLVITPDTQAGNAEAPRSQPQGAGGPRYGSNIPPSTRPGSTIPWILGEGDRILASTNSPREPQQRSTIGSWRRRVMGQPQSFEPALVREIGLARVVNVTHGDTLGVGQPNFATDPTRLPIMGATLGDRRERPIER